MAKTAQLQARPEKSAAGDGSPASPEALQALDTAAEKTTKQDAVKFWEGVDGAELDDARSGMLSWEEAAKRGLVPPKTPSEK